MRPRLEASEAKRATATSVLKVSLLAQKELIALYTDTDEAPSVQRLALAA